MTYTMVELCERTRLCARSIRRYMTLGLIPQVRNAGVSTRYTDEQLVRLLAIKKHYAEVRYRSRDQLRAFLEGRTLDELRAYVAPPAPAESAPPASVAEDGPIADEPEEAADVQAARVPGERWARVALLPGLELLVSDDARPLVQRIAAEIRERYQSTG